MEKQKLLKVLGIQIQSKLGDKKTNYKKIQDAIEEGFKPGVDIIVLPEVWTVGWSPDLFQESAEELENGEADMKFIGSNGKQSEVKNGETIIFLKNLAKKYNCYILGGSYITKQNGKYYNTCAVIDDKGKLITYYNKAHLFSYYGCNEGSYIEEGNSPVLVDIKGIKTGITICYDIRFPEIFRAYRKAGADLLVNMAAWPKSREIHWKTLTSARAIENQCNFIAITQSGLIKDNEYNLGISRVINYDGTVNKQITEKETSFYAEIKFDEEMYEFRKKCPILNDIHKNYEVKIV